MALLSLGTPLTWEEAKKLAEHVREHGIAQFLAIWNKLKDREGDELKWGDEVGAITPFPIGVWCSHVPYLVLENDCAYDNGTKTQIEYMVVLFDDVEKNAKLSLRQTEILAELKKVEAQLTLKTDEGDEYVFSRRARLYPPAHGTLSVLFLLPSTQNMVVIC
jgi:glutamate--cysteine ligase catalytic subunit